MKVRELQERLSSFDPEARVVLSERVSDYEECYLPPEVEETDLGGEYVVMLSPRPEGTATRLPGVVELWPVDGPEGPGAERRKLSALCRVSVRMWDGSEHYAQQPPLR
jgi:hypothetical protein